MSSVFSPYFHKHDGTDSLVVASWKDYPVLPGISSFNGDGTLGNGSVVAKYIQTGKLVHCYFYVTAGSTSTFGTGGGWFTNPLPVPADSLDISTNWREIIYQQNSAGNTVLGPYPAQIVQSHTPPYMYPVTTMGGTTGFTGLLGAGATYFYRRTYMAA